MLEIPEPRKRFDALLRLSRAERAYGCAMTELESAKQECAALGMFEAIRRIERVMRAA